MHSSSSKEKLLIRKASIEELFLIRDLLRSTFKESIERFGEAPPNYDSLDKLEKHILNEHCYLGYAYEGSSLVGGYIAYPKTGEVYYLSRIFVHPKFSGQGFGSQLLNHMFNTFKKAKVWELHSVREDEVNKEFYEKFGFIKVGEETPYKVVLSIYRKEL